LIHGIYSEHNYIDKKTLFYWKTTTLGSEKATILGWHEDRIIKTVYFQRDDKLYGVILPMPYRVKQKGLSDILEISKREAASLKLATTYPRMQQPHSMTPFICDEDVGLVEKVIFLGIQFTDYVDFSYPGRMDISIHMDYDDAISMLMNRYPKIIIKGGLVA
jgi:prolyl-tRNA editing enzyme YbaK/EbsC (Cys-tRNA(Pro) deacylase)